MQWKQLRDSGTKDSGEQLESDDILFKRVRSKRGQLVIINLIRLNCIIIYFVLNMIAAAAVSVYLRAGWSLANV